MMFEAAQVWRNQSQWHFCVVNSTFIFTFIYGFLQALKQDNKSICSNVQLVSHFNSSRSSAALHVEQHPSVAPKIFGPDV